MNFLQAILRRAFRGGWRPDLTRGTSIVMSPPVYTPMDDLQAVSRLNRPRLTEMLHGVNPSTGLLWIQGVRDGQVFDCIIDDEPCSFVDLDMPDKLRAIRARLAELDQGDIDDVE